MRSLCFLGLTAAALSLFISTSTAAAAPTDTLVCKLTPISLKRDAAGKVIVPWQLGQLLGAPMTFNNVHCNNDTKDATVQCCRQFHVGLQLTPFPIGGGTFVSPFSSAPGNAWIVEAGFFVPVNKTSCTSTPIGGTTTTGPVNSCYQTPAIEYVVSGTAIVQ